MVKDFSDVVLNEENYTYDAAGNITDAPESCFVYDTNNRLTVFNGSPVTYDLDGNMLSNGCTSFEYDSANRLIKAGGHAYTYNAEDVRISNLCGEVNTTYTYDTNCRLSQLLEKTTNGVVTKYVYGLGLIGEECDGSFKTYHFDSRGSTVAITDINGVVTDTFNYDTYGNLVSRCGSSEVIFGYNGRDGVITDKNGLIYMRARYYSPEMRRFVNADILHGEISDSTSLNRYSYVNGNPVSFVDPSGLVKERGSLSVKTTSNTHQQSNPYSNPYFYDIEIDWLKEQVKNSTKPATIGPGPVSSIPESIPNHILEQILSVHNDKRTSHYYNKDYKNHARMEVDSDGNITYIFYVNGKNWFETYTKSTEYHFEVNKASYWKSMLDYEGHNIFDNEIISGVFQFCDDLGSCGLPLSEIAKKDYSGLD